MNPSFRNRPRAHAHRSTALAVAMALFALLVAVAGAQASGGSGGVGTGTGGSSSGGTCPHKRFGSRTLAKGDCGDDVKTLNWLLKAKASRAVQLKKTYKTTTVSAVRSFERAKRQPVNGVVEKRTRKALTRSLSSSEASWYGPGLWGNGTACGKTLHKRTIGVAHKTLPCGTRVVFGYRGHWVRARVIDRGPYVRNRQWDLTKATWDKLHLGGQGVADVKAAKIK